MAEDFLPPFLRAAVQAFLPARRPESRERSSLTARGSAYAKRCVCTVVAGRAGADLTELSQASSLLQLRA